MMLRPLLRLLLIASLVLNGIGAPWAMTQSHRHGDADGHPAASSSGADHAGQGHADRAHVHAATDAHAGHAGHASVRSDGVDAEAAVACCDGPGCDCGCLLPPMLARSPASAPMPAWSTPTPIVAVQRVALRRTLPPFRPPAG